MELRKNCRKLTTALSRFWHRPAGPMNWKNPIRVTAYIGWELFNGVAFLVGEWVRYGVRAGQIFLAIPPTVILFSGGVWFAVWSFVRRPFPALETVPLLDLLEYHNPNFYSAVVVWYYLSPLVTVMLAGSILLSIWKVWIEARKRDLIPFGALPAWPLSPEQPGPEIVIGEVHHPVEPMEVFNPEWLTIPERGLYTGIAIFGAVGSGKTSACMHPFAKQLLGWQADDPEKRAAALMLEVKGNCCHDVRSILNGAGRGDDYLELGMGGLWKWNPLSAWWLDSYSLAYTVASLLNQLFGKGKEPFWQQAYTNLVRWIIELHRVLPEQWVTLQQVYHYHPIRSLRFARTIVDLRDLFAFQRQGLEPALLDNLWLHLVPPLAPLLPFSFPLAGAHQLFPTRFRQPLRPLDEARMGIDPEIKFHPRLRPTVKMSRQREIRVPAQAHLAKTGLSDQLDTPIHPFGGSLMRGTVARAVDGIEHFSRIGQRHDQRRIAPLPVVADIHPFLAFAAGGGNRPIHVDLRPLEEPGRLLGPDLAAALIDGFHQIHHVGRVKAVDKISGGAGGGDLLRSHRLQVNSHSDAAFRYLDSGSPPWPRCRSGSTRDRIRGTAGGV